MPSPPPRQELIAGIVADGRQPRSTSSDAGIRARLADTQQMPVPRAPRASAEGNPFSSLYQSRRQLSAASSNAESASVTSGVTRAYTPPESLMALARGDAELQASSVDGRPSLAQWLETFSDDGATKSTSMFQLRRLLNIGAELGAMPNLALRAVRRLALRVVGWVHGRFRQSPFD